MGLVVALEVSEISRFFVVCRSSRNCIFELIWEEMSTDHNVLSGAAVKVLAQWFIS